MAGVLLLQSMQIDRVDLDCCHARTDYLIISQSAAPRVPTGCSADGYACTSAILFVDKRDGERSISLACLHLHLPRAHHLDLGLNNHILLATGTNCWLVRADWPCRICRSLRAGRLRAGDRCAS
jgi:hypothetical protein